MKLTSFLLVLLSACAQLPTLPTGPVAVPKPEIRVSAVTLEAHPSNKMLASFYCGQYVNGLAALGCKVFGSLPQKPDMRFTFSVTLTAKNPATVPMPVVSALVAFTAYPEAQGGQNLGAVCVTMCEDPMSCPQSDDACASTTPEIRGMNDFAGAAAGFLVNAALTGGSNVDAMRMPMVPPGGELPFKASLSLNVDQMLTLIKTLGADVMGDLKAGRIPTFEIPWAVEGSAWVTIEGFGRIGAPFPRQTGAWQLQQ